MTERGTEQSHHARPKVVFILITDQLFPFFSLFLLRLYILPIEPQIDPVHRARLNCPRRFLFQNHWRNNDIDIG